MMTNKRFRRNGSSAWQSKMASGACLALLMAVAAAGQDQGDARANALDHPIPSAPQRSYEPASVRALAGLQCLIYPEGSTPSAGLTVFTDDDGYARFHAVRQTAADKVQRLTLDCKDSAGRPSVFSVDLTSDETFAPRPLNLATERGTDRPALAGDPLSYSQSELIQAGYGLRPDPEKEPDAYSRWLASAVQPGRMLEAKRPSSHSHTVTKETAPYWVGSVLGGSPSYISVEGNFNVPKGIPGGDETTGTEMAIWNGLGGFGTGSGLIQAGVNLETTPLVALYGSWREYCCGDSDSNGYGGAFTPKPGDNIYDQNWYCDSKGNLNIKGGYGCSFVHDLTSGAILSCTSATGKPCWSVKASSGMTLGVNAEFIIENQSGQCCKPATQFDDFTPEVTMTGSAYSSKTGAYSQTISSDSHVYLLTDFTKSTSHMNVSLGKTNQTYFSVSQFEQVSGAALSAVSITCGNGEGCYSESIGVGPNADGSNIGDPWVLGTSNVGDDFHIYHWESNAWVEKSGAGVMIAVSPNGYPWIVNHLGEIYYWNGSAFVLAPGKGCATSIGVGPNAFGSKYGDPWIIGCNGGYHADASIYQLQGSKWVKQSGAGLKIAVSPDLGFPWVINAAGGIYFNPGSGFSKIATGCATSIAVGPLAAGITFGDAFGDAWITGCTASGTGYEIYQLQEGKWVQIPGTAAQIAVSPDLGVPWIINDKGQIFE
ncbi:MAG: G1 family glutamic endopeptidase [Bryobacteraceae bacterium]